jgi:hypothetical protein
MNPDPGGTKTYGSGFRSGSATLLASSRKKRKNDEKGSGIVRKKLTIYCTLTVSKTPPHHVLQRRDPGGQILATLEFACHGGILADSLKKPVKNKLKVHSAVVNLEIIILERHKIRKVEWGTKKSSSVTSRMQIETSQASEDLPSPYAKHQKCGELEGNQA